MISAICASKNDTKKRGGLFRSFFYYVYRFFEQVERDVESGEEADFVLRFEDEDSVLLALCDDLGGVLRRLNADHKAHARNALDTGLAGESFENVVGFFSYFREEFFVYS